VSGEQFQAPGSGQFPFHGLHQPPAYSPVLRPRVDDQPLDITDTFFLPGPDRSDQFAFDNGLPEDFLLKLISHLFQGLTERRNTLGIIDDGFLGKSPLLQIQDSGQIALRCFFDMDIHRSSTVCGKSGIFRSNVLASPEVNIGKSTICLS